VFDWLYLTVMRPGADSFIGRRMRRNILGGTDTLIGMSEDDLTSAGIRRVGRVISALDGRPILQGGTFADVASIIWATGFRPDFSWLACHPEPACHPERSEGSAFDSAGFPIHRRGVTDIPGLYFLGLRFQHRLNSSLIGGVGEDARFIADSIAARYGHTRRTSSIKASNVFQSSAR
jgi:putative flavoprotein involved in K+ transport